MVHFKEFQSTVLANSDIPIGAKRRKIGGGKLALDESRFEGDDIVIRNTHFIADVGVNQNVIVQQHRQRLKLSECLDMRGSLVRMS